MMLYLEVVTTLFYARWREGGREWKYNGEF